MIRNERIVWGALWRWGDPRDNGRSHLLNENCLPVLFRTRKAARDWIEIKYGYIKVRQDLRAKPHGWRMPIPVRVGVAPISKGDYK